MNKYIIQYAGGQETELEAEHFEVDIRHNAGFYKGPGRPPFAFFTGVISIVQREQDGSAKEAPKAPEEPKPDEVESPKFEVEAPAP